MSGLVSNQSMHTQNLKVKQQFRALYIIVRCITINNPTIIIIIGALRLNPGTLCPPLGNLPGSRSPGLIVLITTSFVIADWIKS